MLKSVLPLSFIISTRFFGLFIVLPVMSLYALKLDGASEFLVGALFGVYALTQMLFQVPFGALSDKIGRKKALFIGLCVFIIGCVLCALATDIYALLVGRALQGAGAVGAVAAALISDFTTEEQRSKAMAVMGALIGLAFCLSMPLAPFLSEKFGFSSLFWLSLFLTLICIILLFTIVPKEPKISSTNAHKTPILSLLAQKNLALMNLTNFMQKCLMSLTFLLVPIILVRKLGFENLGELYLCAMLAGFVAMGFAGGFGEKRGYSKGILLGGIVLFALAYALLSLSFGATFISFDYGVDVLIAAVIVFFVGFSLHEPIMQSVASKFARTSERGTALGVFNAFGYAGSFVGGILGGAFLQIGEILVLTSLLSLLCVLWFVLLFFLKNPSDFKNLYLPLDAKATFLGDFGEANGDFNSTLKGDFKGNGDENGGLSGNNLGDKNTAFYAENGIVEIYKTQSNIVIKFDKKLTSETEILKRIAG